MSIRTTRDLTDDVDSTTPVLRSDVPFGADDPYGPVTRQIPAVVPTPDDSTEPPSWNLPQAVSVLAGAGAAATSTLVGGHLGVAGTVVGAAVASIVTTLAVNLYDNTLRRTVHRLRLTAQRVRHPETAPRTLEPSEPRTRPVLSRRVVRWAALTALIGTVLGLGLMIGIERSTADPITPGTSRLAEATGSGTAPRESSRTVPADDPQHDASTAPEAADASAEPSARPSAVTSPTSPATATSSSGSTTDSGTTSDPGTLADSPAGTSSGTSGAESGASSGTTNNSSGSGTTSTGDTVRP